MPNKMTGHWYFESLQADLVALPAGGISDAEVSATAAIQRSKLQQETLAEYPVPLPSGYTWDAAATNVPAAAANDDLGLVTGTPGSAAISLQTGDLKNAGATTRKVGFTVVIPPEYVAGETAVLRISGGMISTVASATATVDVECWKSDEDATAGADICATSAQSINSLTFADKDFTLTPTTLAPGDILEIVISVAVTDSATASAVIGCIGAIKLCLDIKG